MYVACVLVTGQLEHANVSSARVPIFSQAAVSVSVFVA